MTFETMYWADSLLKSIYIEYDRATLLVYHDVSKKDYFIECSGLIGIDDLCIWDDTIIMEASIQQVNKSSSDYIKKVYSAYDEKLDYGGRTLSDGVVVLRIKLTNEIEFGVFCQKIHVTDAQTVDETGENETEDGSVIEP